MVTNKFILDNAWQELNKTVTKDNLNVGDIVIFNGGYIYFPTSATTDWNSKTAIWKDKYQCIYFNMEMSKNISLKIDENIITLYVYEKVFEITEDYVIIDGNRFLRNTDDKYRDTEDIILTFGRDTVIQERRVDNG